MKPRIIDCHAHLIPKELMSHLKRIIGRDSNRFSVIESGDNAVNKLIEQHEAAGIDKAVLLGWNWPDKQMCRDHNDFIKEVIDTYPERFYAFASLNPIDGWPAVWELERCYLMGFTGVGELDPCRGLYSMNNKRFLQVMEAADIYNMPVTIHASPPGVALSGVGEKTIIDDFYDIALRFPNIDLIISHLGGGLPYYELWPEVKKALTNVYYDTASISGIYDISSILKTADITGNLRVLFGSGYPLFTGENGDLNGELVFQTFIKETKALLDPDKNTFEYIMGANTERLLSRKQQNN